MSLRRRMRDDLGMLRQKMTQPVFVVNVHLVGCLLWQYNCCVGKNTFHARAISRHTWSLYLGVTRISHMIQRFRREHDIEKAALALRNDHTYTAVHLSANCTLIEANVSLLLALGHCCTELRQSTPRAQQC